MLQTILPLFLTITKVHYTTHIVQKDILNVYFHELIRAESLYFFLFDAVFLILQQHFIV